jgi:acylphosphatase
MGDGEGSTWLRSAATSLAVAAIVLVLVNAVLIVRNQGAQREVNQRQQVINQGAQIAHVSQVLVETAARAAVQNKDDKLTALLERHGVHITFNQPQTPAAPAGGKP